MRRLLPLIALSLVFAVPAPAATEKRCGTVETLTAAQDIRAIGVSCRTARSLARKHHNSSGRNEVCDLAKPSCRLRGFTCRRTFFGNSGTRVRCADGARRVRWFYGA